MRINPRALTFALLTTLTSLPILLSSPALTEDSPTFNCAIHGNRTCGPVCALEATVYGREVIYYPQGSREVGRHAGVRVDCP